MRRRARWTVAFLGAALLGACDDVTVVQAGDTSHASEALQRAGIASRVTDEGVRVRSDDVARAVVVLRAAWSAQPGFEAAYANPSLVPAPREEQARATQALSGELARTIEAMPGVRGARVHVSEPLPRDVTLDAREASVHATASVWVQHTHPVDADAIRQLVAHAVTGLRASDVMLVETVAPPEPLPVPPNAFDLRRPLVLSLALNALLALALIASRVRAPGFLTSARKDSNG